MAVSGERLDRWRERRTRRLQERGLMRAQSVRGGPPAYYVADEVLVRDEHRDLAHDVLNRQGHAPRDTVADATLVRGFRRLRARDLDVTTAARTIRERAAGEGDDRPAATPNHIFLSTLFEHGGPFGPPVPAPAAELTNSPKGPRVGVTVIDTGIWRDSPLPARYYRVDDADIESDVDVDDDGVIDGDVGHANFIAGVIAQRTAKADIRVLRVLDTFGICTEAELVTALGRVDDDATLVNLSLGGFTVDDQAPLVLADALDDLLASGDRLVVAAAGNDGQRGRPFWPAAFATGDDRVLAVAAHDSSDLCEWSNAGDWVTLAAPGADLTSTFVRHPEFGTGWAQWSGTSFATPYVVAALAEKLAAGASAAAARAAVLADASDTYAGYPGLP
ncbi:S8/S53 family peptidase [Luedemannella flava]